MKNEYFRTLLTANGVTTWKHISGFLSCSFVAKTLSRVMKFLKSDLLEFDHVIFACTPICFWNLHKASISSDNFGVTIGRIRA